MKNSFNYNNENINDIYNHWKKYGFVVVKNLLNNEIVIGMGAGSISNWMKELPNLI